jgi:hypothetical protein
VAKEAGPPPEREAAGASIADPVRRSIDSTPGVDTEPQGSSGVQLAPFPPLPPARAAAASAAPSAPAGVADAVEAAAAGLGRVRSLDFSEDSDDGEAQGAAVGGIVGTSQEQSDAELASAMVRFEEGLTQLSYARTSDEATSALASLLTTLRVNRSLSGEGIRKDNLENVKRHGRALFARLREERGRERLPAARFGEYDVRVAKAYGRVLREMSTARTLLVAMQLLDDDIFFEDNVPAE